MKFKKFFMKKRSEIMYSFEDLRKIIAKLRSKEGCPWDREQTYESLKNALLKKQRKFIRL